MILARSLASTSLTNKGERSRVYDAARFNKRGAKQLGENIWGCCAAYIYAEGKRKVSKTRRPDHVDQRALESQFFPLPRSSITVDS